MYKDIELWVGGNEYGIEAGLHYFGSDGKMLVQDVENGAREIVEKDGKLYLMIDKSTAPEGLYEIDGEYYYAQAYGVLAVDKEIYATTELLDGTGWYRFGADGQAHKERLCRLRRIYLLFHRRYPSQGLHEDRRRLLYFQRLQRKDV